MADSSTPPPSETHSAPHHRVPPPLSRNLLSFAGWLIVVAVGVILVIMIAIDLLFHSENPYNSVITYLVLPGILGGGVFLILLGVGWEWLRRHRHDPHAYPRLPVVNLNLKWQRKRVMLATVLLVMLFTLSAFGIYHSYHFTESPVFCGLVCHEVMEPEYTAYQHSPHARVSCAECHIGSGADWYVKSKMSGLRQVWAVATNSYHLPIETPVRDLRPAQETCEQCHWPDKFMDSVEKTLWHFSPDRVNTPIRYNLLLKIGGGQQEMGLGKGIHWHVSPEVTVRYWARDKDRMDIPWVEMQEGDNPPQVFRTEDCPDPLPADAEIRRMDCMDCHNRPSHVFRSPRQIIDFYMATGTLDRSLPYFKRYATTLFETRWPDTPTALEAIETELNERYAAWVKGDQGRQLVNQNIEWLQELYQRNIFPEQGVDWRVYPNHNGHFEYPGCYRCHDDEHVSAEKEVISNDCTLCHELLDQQEGEAAFGPIKFQGGPFEHPRNLGQIWEGRNCTDCHGLEQELEVTPNQTLTQAGGSARPAGPAALVTGVSH